jgi:dTDP-4-dehydrorhamnose 3,5-epimerase
MHLQINQWQLVSLARGELIDVLIDLNRSSSTFLHSTSLKLSENGINQILIGPGIAHGYGVLSDDALIHYKSSVYYGDTPQFGISWSSEELVTHLPQHEWIMSVRDSNFPTCKELIVDPFFREQMKNF